MRLYYSPGACSLAPHLVAREGGIELDLVKVDLTSKRTADDRDFHTVNPKGYVPTLELDDGRVVTEVAVVVQYLADLKPESGLVPACGTFERYRVQEMLNFVGTELHKRFTPLWHRPSDEVRAPIVAAIVRRLADVERHLGAQTLLFGDVFTVADAYLYAILRWARITKVPVPDSLQAYMTRLVARPAVQAVHAAEGIKL
jgi:glutathione S-transferase